jgi:hypothetical protein
LHDAKNLPPVFQGGVYNPFGVGCGQRHRFFDYHVMACFDREDGLGGMEAVWGANVQDIGFYAASQEDFEAGEEGDGGGFGTQGAGGDDVAEGYEISAGFAGYHFGVALSNVTAADYGEPYFLLSGRHAFLKKRLTVSII